MVLSFYLKRKIAMRKMLFLLPLFIGAAAFAQAPKSPCLTNPVYRQFDFWIGDWDVYGINGKKAGDSKIELILDSCIILENWKSANGNYAGKSFNTYNSTTGQWQQTWVDNAGGSTEYLEGQLDGTKMIFRTKPFSFSNDTVAVRRLSFYHLSRDKVRQHGEITKDNGASWKTEYDLEYRRRK
jgi:hypothetical protein